MRTSRKTRNRCTAIAATLAVFAALALAGPAVASAGGASPFFGVTTTASPTNTDLQAMGRARVGVLRQPFSWGDLQPIPGGPYFFAELDRIVAGAASAGVTVVPFLFGTPLWARNCAAVPAFYCDRVTPLASPLGSAGWTALLQALVARYGPTGTLWTNTKDAYSPPYLPITRWQVWNEPNSPKYLRPSATPRAYYDLLKASVTAIRSVDPNARILLGGLYGTPPKPGISMWRFLDRLYRFKGVKRLFDDVAIHPYSTNVKGIIAQLEHGREVIRAHRDRAGMRLTEIGWGSGAGNSGLYRGLGGQSAMLSAAFKLSLKSRKRFGVSGIDWFSWRDLPPGAGGNCSLCESFGLLNVDSSVKPALAAFTRFTGGQP
jgi:polysaccharide biosynthesis protein PslG